ncbi:MAG: hypothetical protein H7Y32_09970, partial [Chloroflexales bacterium]|nr:hypothetical protein [Chloroflexales bacterium]
MAANDPPRSTETIPEPPIDVWARRLRETMAAFIAGVVVLSFVVMTGLAFFYTDNNETFTRAKDLLLFINSVLGVVIGFYFNKVSTEGRAESAENTARTASANAQQAVEERAEATAQATQATAQATQATQVATQAEQARQEATQQAAQAQQQADEAVSLLGDVSASAQAVLSQPRPAGGVLGAGGVEPE